MPYLKNDLSSKFTYGSLCAESLSNKICSHNSTVSCQEYSAALFTVEEELTKTVSIGEYGDCYIAQ